MQSNSHHHVGAIPASLLGFTMTALLVYLMGQLIRDDRAVTLTESRPFHIAFLPEIAEPSPPERHLPKRPPAPETPPATVLNPLSPGHAEGPAIDGRGPMTPVDHFKPVLLADGDAISVFRPMPKYPRNAIRQHIEGYVLLELTIANTGAVSRATVLESQPAGVFDRAAVDAALRSRYRPMVVDGIPVERDGVLVRTVFEMPD
jgi:protein TonB